MRHSRLCVCLASLALLVLVHPGLPAQDANADYRAPRRRSLEAESLSDPQLAERLNAQGIPTALHVRAGMTVADVGAGAGLMMPLLSRAVGLSGKTYSEDIFEEFIERARTNARAEGLRNVDFVLGTSPKPAGRVLRRRTHRGHLVWSGNWVHPILRRISPWSALAIMGIDDAENSRPIPVLADLRGWLDEPTAAVRP